MKTSAPTPPTRTRLQAAAIAGAALLAGIVSVAGFRAAQDEAGHQGFKPSAPDASAPRHFAKAGLHGEIDAASGGLKNEAASQTAAAAELTVKIRGFAARFAALRTEHDETSSKEYRTAAFEALAELRRTLHDAPSDEAGAAAVAVLESRDDFATGLGFSLGEGGALHEAPTLRAALLDMLSEVDPARSVACARQVLAQSTCAEEWALAMRNLQRQNQDGAHTGELRQALGSMLDNQSWLRNPAAGFLEALDVAAALGGVEEFHNLASVLHLEDASGEPVQSGVSAAAFSALERMTTNHPAQTVELLGSDPALLSWAPEERGALMARASMADAAQRAAVENYLLRTDLKPEEIAAFAGAFPNSTVMLGNHLAADTEAALDAGPEMADADAVLALVKQWQQDPRFDSRQAELEQISARLSAESQGGGSIAEASQIP